MSKETIELMVEGGNAKPGPATAPKFSQYKLNMGEIFQKINEETKEYKKMNVPVKVIIDTETKEYTIKVGVPPVSSLIKKELGLDRIGSSGSKKKASEETTEKKETKKKDDKKVKKETEEPAEKPQPEQVKIAGNLTIDQCIKIAKMKQSGMLSKTLKSAVKEIVASCVSMPLTIEGKSPKEILKEIDAGVYDNKLH